MLSDVAASIERAVFSSGRCVFPLPPPLSCAYVLVQVRAGDCIVAFSKADICSIKQEIEAKTGYGE